jgi:hypothetical protein
VIWRNAKARFFLDESFGWTEIHTASDSAPISCQDVEEPIIRWQILLKRMLSMSSSAESVDGRRFERRAIENTERYSCPIRCSADYWVPGLFFHLQNTIISIISHFGLCPLREILVSCLKTTVINWNNTVPVGYSICASGNIPSLLSLSQGRIALGISEAARSRNIF